jgi:hypothetical protein
MEELTDEARFAYPCLTQDYRDARLAHAGGVVLGDECTKLFVAA